MSVKLCEKCKERPRESFNRETAQYVCRDCDKEIMRQLSTRYIFDLDAWKNRTDDDAKQWVEEQFPEKHYGKDILIYEAWDMRALLEQAYMAGKESK